MTRKKQRSPYEGRLNELERILNLVNEAECAMIDARDDAQHLDFDFLAGYMEPVTESLIALEQIVINAIEVEKSED